MLSLFKTEILARIFIVIGAATMLVSGLFPAMPVAAATTYEFQNFERIIATRDDGTTPTYRRYPSDPPDQNEPFIPGSGSLIFYRDPGLQEGPCTDIIELPLSTWDEAEAIAASGEPIDGQFINLVSAEEDGVCAYQDFGETITISGTETIDDPIGGGTEEDPVPTCESEGGALAWIACESIRGLLRAVAGISEIMGNFLQVRPLVGNDTDPIFTVWKNMRNIALVFLTIAFLIAIFGQALSINIDAYTMKKMIPRMAIASIGIMLSFYVCAFLIDIFNVLGRGLYDLMFGATSGLNIEVNSASGWAAIVTTAVLGGALAVALSPAVIATIGLMLLPVALSFVTGLLVILLRQVVIVAAVILSPIAFAAWILPNTEDWFKRWRGLFSTMLMMYPIIMVLLAAGSIFSVILVSGGAGGTEGISENNFFNYILAITALGVTVGAIPFTLKAAGGILNTIAGRFNDPNRGLADRFRNRMTGAREKAVEKRHQDQAYYKKTGLNPKTGQPMRGLGRLRGASWRAAHRFNTYAGSYSDENRAEIEAQALGKSDRLNLISSESEEKAYKLEAFKFRDEMASIQKSTNPKEVGKVLRDMYLSPETSDAKRRVIFENMVARKDKELGDIYSNVATSDTAGGRQLLSKLNQDNFGKVFEFAPQWAVSDLSQGAAYQPNWEFAENAKGEALANLKDYSVLGTLAGASRQGRKKEFEQIISSYADIPPEERDVKVVNQIKSIMETGQFKDSYSGETITAPADLSPELREKVQYKMFTNVPPYPPGGQPPANTPGSGDGS